MTFDEMLHHHDRAEARRLRLSGYMVEALHAMAAENGSAFVGVRTCEALERRGLGARTGRTRGVRHLCALTDQGREAADALFGRKPGPEYPPGYMQGRGAA